MELGVASQLRRCSQLSQWYQRITKPIIPHIAVHFSRHHLFSLDLAYNRAQVTRSTAMRKYIGMKGRRRGKIPHHECAVRAIYSFIIPRLVGA